jgi:hypothetical protein
VIARRRAHATAVVMVVGLAMVVVGCTNDSKASSGEQAVCATMQQVIHQLEQGDRSGALDTFLRLPEATAASGNETMRVEGSAFFDYVSRPVDDHEDMTVQETIDFANEALARSSVHIDAIADECNALGRPIEITDPKAFAPAP